MGGGRCKYVPLSIRGIEEAKTGSAMRDRKRTRHVAQVRPGARKRAEQGLALPLALIVVFLVTVLGLALLEAARKDSVDAVRDVQDIGALEAAEMGLARARAMALSQKLPWCIMTWNNSQLSFYRSSDAMYSGNQVVDLFTDEPVGGSSTATYSVVIENLAEYLPTSGQYRMHAFGTDGTRTRHVIQDSLTVTYASFGWLTNSERYQGTRVYFASGDVVDGWVYTNDQLNIYGSPVFKGKVNSAASSVNYYPYTSNNPDFQKGLFLNSPKLDMSTLISAGHVTALRDRSLEASGIHLPSNEGRPYRAFFASDGTVTIEKKNADTTWETVIQDKDLSMTNGAIYIEEQVEVKGTVNGQVTLGTPQNKDIIVTDDLVYAHPPHPEDVFQADFDASDSQFNDKLGLIAGGDIIFKKPWNSSWDDMTVMGSLLAVTGSIRNYYYTTGPVKTLHVYGGLAQNNRGPVGRSDGRGFRKDYWYDTRFVTDPPPHYPMATYDFSAWDVDP